MDKKAEKATLVNKIDVKKNRFDTVTVCQFLGVFIIALAYGLQIH